VPDGFDLLERATAGDSAAVAAVLRDIERWVEDCTDTPLQQYLHLPVDAAARNRHRRNKALMQAAREISAESQSAGALRLKHELDIFLTRGPWFAWRDDGAPPEDATPLRRALFYVVKFNDGQDISYRHLRRLVGQTWAVQWPTIRTTMNASDDEDHHATV
jgi:hypothetical protein